MANAAGRIITDFLTAPRFQVEEAWADVHASVFEARREVARAYVADREGGDPQPHLFAADRRLVRLDEFARRQAGEAAGITYIDRAQLPLWDGCGPDSRSTA